MVIRVLNDRSVVKDTDPYGTQNENQVTTLNFVIPEEYASFNKKIVFITPNGVYWDLITNDTYIIKNNVTKYRNVSAYVWLVDVENQVDFRTKIFYIDFNQNTNPDNFIPSSEEISGYDTMIAELNELIQEVEDLGALHYEIVEELPTEDIDPTAVYLILREESEPNNIYDEWMYINEEWELIGTTAIDLQPLQKEIDEINEMLFTHTTAESVNQEVSLNGNPNLEMNVTELDGRTEQDSTKGYQLFSTTLEQGTINSSSGQNTSSDTIIRSVGYCDIEPSTEYTIDISTNKSVGLRYYDANGDFISSVNAAATPRTFTSVENAYKIRFIFTSTTDTAAKVTLEKGSSVHEWEPYTHGASPNPEYEQEIKVVTGNQDVVVSGKNIFNKNVEKKSAYPSQTIGSAVTYGTSSATYSYVNCAEIKAGKTYTISWKQDTTPASTSGRVGVIVDNSNIVLATQGTWVNSVTYITFTATVSGKLILATDINTSEIMIYEGEYDSGITYEPYITPITKQVHLGDIELAKIGTYKDKIYPSGGKWYLHKEIKKVTLDETLNWEGGEVATGIYRYQITLADAINIAQRQNVLTEYTHFTLTGEVGTGFIYSQIFYFYPNTDCTNALLFKAWIAEHNTPLYYPLATPTDTEITGTLKEELNAIQKLQQLNGTTIVSIEGDLAADFKLVYENDSISDLDTRVTNLENTVVDVENTFDTLSEATAKNMGSGTIFKVLERNAIYVVGDNDNTTTDSIFKIALNNGKYAYLQYNDSINFEVSGEVPEEERSFSGKDMKNVLLKFIDRIKTYDADIREIVFNSGTWLFSPTCINLENQNKSLNIRGKIPVRVFNDYAGVNFTSFAPYASEQTYIIKLGGNAAFENNPTGSRGLSISDIRFTSMYTNDKDDLSHVVTRGALYIDNNSGGVYPRLDFYRINGVCLAIRGSFELDFGILNVRTKIGLDYDAIVFDDITGSNSVYNNISSCNFNTIRLENLAGNHIYINPKSNFDMNTINYFEVEENYPSFSSYGYSKHTDYDGTQTIDIQTSVFHGMFRRLQINHMNMSMHSDYYGTYEDTILGEINYRVAEVFCYDTPTTETNKYFKLQVANMYIRYVNQSNALANKQYICTKKYNCGNELIQIGNVYLDTQVQNQGSLFRVVNTKFSRLFVENIKDLSQTDYNNLFGYHKAYELAHFTATGNIVPFDNSKFTEGLGLGYSGTVNAKFENSNPNPHDIMIGLYCPTGAYKFTIQTDNGNVIVQDSSVATARYVNVKATINPSVGSQVGLQIASTTQDIIFDYVKELNQEVVSSVSSSSTNSQVPGAKLFYDTIGDIGELLDELNGTEV